MGVATADHLIVILATDGHGADRAGANQLGRALDGVVGHGWRIANRDTDPHVISRAQLGGSERTHHAPRPDTDVKDGGITDVSGGRWQGRGGEERGESTTGEDGGGGAPGVPASPSRPQGPSI